MSTSTKNMDEHYTKTVAPSWFMQELCQTDAGLNNVGVRSMAILVVEFQTWWYKVGHTFFYTAIRPRVQC